MQPLNPFLRAFFRSALPLQCLPIHHHILLVPTTEVLQNGKDRESNTSYAELAATEDFLASHVLRVAGGIPPGQAGIKDGRSMRENKSKPRQYPTIDGRTVIIKDMFVYSNKGFKTLNQAQLLQDFIYYPPDSPDGQQWLVYYISRPLTGTYQHLPLVPAVISDEPSKERRRTLAEASSSDAPTEKSNAKKKEIKDFADLMNQYPMISKQLQNGLEKIIREFVNSNEVASTSKRTSRRSSISSQRSDFTDSAVSIRSSLSAGSSTIHPTAIELAPEEVVLRDNLETAVSSAIALFQDVDKVHLSQLGATTDLTGPAVEHMIEKYIVEQVHDRTLFPRVCALRKVEDNELDAKIRRMTDVDIAQVSIPIENGMRGKRMLAARLSKGVETFKKIAVSSSPQEMLEILLSTQKVITESSMSDGVTQDGSGEKPSAMLTINADLLVSMLLIVVIRSGARQLHSRLLYMRFFIFTDEVESGEQGYALATMEAVLAHLSSHASILRTVSKSNRSLWQATRSGNVQELNEILQNDSQLSSGLSNAVGLAAALGELSSDGEDANNVTDDEDANPSAIDGKLSHVFPWQRPLTPPPETGDSRVKAKKRVSLASMPRSQSVSSGYSSRSQSHSHRRSLDSSAVLAHDLSPETLAQTQDADGSSVLMMAVEARQRLAMRALLVMETLFPPTMLLDDVNSEGTTLLMAATMSGDRDLTNDLIDYLYNVTTQDQFSACLQAQDAQGRTFAHYLFHQPHLIRDLGTRLPWRVKDKNGQTPLFALCRSYDHEQYHNMVDAAMQSATEAQADGGPLHLDDHIDAKGNTLLHIVNDSATTLKIMQYCDVDVNAANDKRFTPLMIGSKYGRIDQVRVLLGDSRVDMTMKDLRGLTAVELAKDDEVRNRIDDLVLLTLPPGPDGRITMVVRSFFVEDATVRMVVKSSVSNNDGTITVTTCRRSVNEFEDLARLLALECPASWLPTQFSLPSPFLIPSKPSRAILRDIQIRLDNFLHNLLKHGTFRMHELVWEFFLVPDLEPYTIEERSKRKAEARVDNVKDDFEPVGDTQEVETFVAFAREQIRGVTTAVKRLLRAVNRQRMLQNDLAEAAMLANLRYALLLFLPENHLKALDRYTKTLPQSEASPMTGLYYSLHSIQSSTSAIQVALDRPAYLIGSMFQAQRSIDRSLSSISRSNRWTPNIGLFEDAKKAVARDAWDKAGKARGELETLACELRYTQQTVASELAVWQEEHVVAGKEMLKNIAREMVVKEKMRLEGMKRALRVLQQGLS